MPEISSAGPDESGPSGRGRLTPISLGDKPGERALVRRCVRGGILGRLVKELYLGGKNPRPLGELKISEYARERGIATPEIVAVAFEERGPIFYRGSVVVREISPGADLDAVLSTGDVSLTEKRHAISSLGKLIAKMHAAGIWHADLHLKNVLLAEAEQDEEGGPKLYLLDLDAARTLRPLADYRRYGNLLRLYRSVIKVNRRGRVVTRTDLVRFLKSYAEGSSCSTREVVDKLDRLLPLWRLKWKCSDALGV
jgi:tRNA A-37 threonylcarbamoyl transferase component Bud32